MNSESEDKPGSDGDRSQLHIPLDAATSGDFKFSTKSESDKKNSILHSFPDIPRKRPMTEEVGDSRKKARCTAVEASPMKREETPLKDATKQKESKKARHKSQRKSGDSE